MDRAIGDKSACYLMGGILVLFCCRKRTYKHLFDGAAYAFFAGRKMNMTKPVLMGLFMRFLLAQKARKKGTRQITRALLSPAARPEPGDVKVGAGRNRGILSPRVNASIKAPDARRRAFGGISPRKGEGRRFIFFFHSTSFPALFC